MAERSLPLLGQSEDRALRIHDLVKAPENTPNPSSGARHGMRHGLRRCMTHQRS